MPCLSLLEEQLSTANVLSYFQLIGSSGLLIYMDYRTAGLLITFMQRTISTMNASYNHA